MHPVSHTKHSHTHCDVTDLVNHGMVKACVCYLLSNFYFFIK